jgi:hypothetical protein
MSSTWDNDIKVHQKYIGCASVNWINMFQDMIQWQDVVKAVINIRFS